MTYNIWTSELFKMRDICGKFQIGDTITFTKVKAYKHFCEYQLEVVNIR
jgi:hypothetical protein